MRRQQRHRQQHAPQSAQPGVLAHHVAVGHDLGPADLIDVALAIFCEIERCRQISQHILDGDRLRERGDPPRADHHGQPLDQRLNHFKRQAPGADDDRCAKLGDRHTARAQHVAGFRAALEMGRERAGITGQPAEINDAAHACARGRAAKIVGGSTIGIGEVRSAAHRVHKVVRGMHAGEGAVERCLVETVAFDDFGMWPYRREPCGISREAPHRAAALFESSKKAAADVTRRAGNENAAHVATLSAA